MIKIEISKEEAKRLANGEEIAMSMSIGKAKSPKQAFDKAFIENKKMPMIGKEGK